MPGTQQTRVATLLAKRRVRSRRNTILLWSGTALGLLAASFLAPRLLEQAPAATADGAPQDAESSDDPVASAHTAEALIERARRRNGRRLSGDDYLREKDLMDDLLQGFRRRADALDEQHHNELFLDNPPGDWRGVFEAKQEGDAIFGRRKAEELMKRRSELWTLIGPDPNSSWKWIAEEFANMQASERRWRELANERHACRLMVRKRDADAWTRWRRYGGPQPGQR